MTDAELVAASNENFVASYRKLVQHCPGGEVHELGGVFAFVTGLPISLFNGCVALEPSASGDLESAVEWVDGYRVPYKVFIVPELEAALGEVPLTRGLDRDNEPYPGMVLHPAPKSPPPAPGVAIAAVDEPGLEEHLDVRVAGGFPRPVARRLFSRSFSLDSEVRLFVGRLDGRPVGASLAVRSATASGVYAVGTLAEARGRGVGTALTWAAVDAGRAWGHDTIVLQSSQMAVSLYSAMGFRTCIRYVSFSSSGRS